MVREDFPYHGGDQRCPEPGELVGRKFVGDDGREGFVVANSALWITVEFGQAAPSPKTSGFPAESPSDSGHDGNDAIRRAVRRAALLELGYLVAVVALFFALAVVLLSKIISRSSAPVVVEEAPRGE